MVFPQTEIIINLDGSELVRRLVEPGAYVIGSDAGADIVVPVEGIAACHATLTVAHGEMRIQDLGSASGTFIAGVLADVSTRIWPNQKVLIGPAVMEARRVRASMIEQTPPPSVAAARRILPEEFLHDRKYEIGGMLGEGGMGAVLSAREATTHRTVAMKVLLSNLSQSDVVRFIAEAQITSQLEHPNIVPVHELGVDEHDQVFYTMKLVQGVTLREVLDRLRAGDPETTVAFPLRRLLIVLMRVCDAMAFAHSRSVLHRDLKPENVMIGDFGEVLVMDWGLAKTKTTGGGMDPSPPDDGSAVEIERVCSVRTNEDDSLTMVGALVGTPHYMSPEQARGETDTLDERADVWALGGILRHILVLARPVSGHTAEDIITHVRAGELVPIPTHGAHCPGGRVPDSLAAVARKAQSVAREGRYASVVEFRNEIDAYLGGFATSAEHASALRQLWLLMGRHRAVTAVLAILLVVSVWFVVRLVASEHRAENNAQTALVSERMAQKKELSARAAAATAERERESARRALARSQFSLADAAYRESDSATMLTALEGVPLDLRDAEWRYLQSHADNSEARLASPDQTWFVGVAAHPTRPGVFALASNTGRIVLARAKSGEWLSDFTTIERQRKVLWFRSLEFSPDGTRLAVGSMGSGGVAIYRVEDGKCLAQWEAPEADVVHFNEDGSQVLTVDGNNNLTVREAETGTKRWSAAPFQTAVFAPHGQIVASYGNRMWLVNAENYALVRELPGTRATIWALSITSDGAIVYVATTDGEIRGLRVSDGQPTFSARLTERRCWPRMALSADGKKLVAATGPGLLFRALRAWDTASGALLPPMLGSSSYIEGVAIHPLTDEVIVTGRDTRSWSLFSRAPQWEMKATEGGGIFGTGDVFYPSGAPVWLAPEGKVTAPSPGEQVPALAGAEAVGPVGEVVVFGVPNARRDLASFTAVRKPPGQPATSQKFEFPQSLHHLRVSPDGARAFMVNDYAFLEIRRTDSGVKLPPLEVGGIRNFNDAAWTAPTRLVGLVNLHERGGPGWEERVILWDSETGRQLANVRHPTAMDCLAVAPDGRTFAEGGAGEKVRLRDATTLEVIRELRVHDGAVTALAFHPTKPLLATGSEDMTIRLWNLDDLSLVEEIRTPGREPRALHFSPSGNFLASESGGSAQVWDLRTRPIVANETAASSPMAEAARFREKGNASARASRWAEARPALEQAIRKRPNLDNNWYQLSPLLVQLGERDAYGRHAHALLGKFGDSSDPVVMERAAKACLLLDTAAPDREAATRLARGAVTAGSHHELLPYFKFAQALGQYRTGDFVAAVESLRDFRGQSPKSILGIQAGAVLAMALHRGGHGDEAQAALSAASQAADGVLGVETLEDLGSGWHDILTARLLLREAASELPKK